MTTTRYAADLCQTKNKGKSGPLTTYMFTFIEQKPQMKSELSAKKRFPDEKQTFISPSNQWQFFPSQSDRFLVFSFTLSHRNNSNHFAL
jgi:hypothetical protein